MKYKVTSKYKGYKYLPKSKDDFIGRIVSYLCRKYTGASSFVLITNERSHGKNNLISTCVTAAETQYMFKSVRLYEYLQTEILSKARARRFTRHVVHKQIFGN